MNLYFFYAMKDGQAFNRLVAADNVPDAVGIFPKVDRVENIYHLEGKSSELDEPTVFDENRNAWAYIQAQRGVFEPVEDTL